MTSGELAELERLRNAEGQWQKDRAEAAARATTLQQRADELSKRLAELNASASTSGQASAEIVRERENLRKDLGGAQGERDQARGEATSLRDQLSAAETDLDASRNEAASAPSAAERRVGGAEGAVRSRRRLRKARRLSPVTIATSTGGRSTSRTGKNGARRSLCLHRQPI